MAFQLTSTGFSHGQRIPKRYTCEGEDICRRRSPGAVRHRRHAASSSHATTLTHPAGTWHHWSLFNVPATATDLKEGLARRAHVDAMRQAVNDFGEIGYRGPCPPRSHGTHHYHFRLLALDVEQLSVKEQAKCKDVESAARSHMVATAELVGTYSR